MICGFLFIYTFYHKSTKILGTQLPHHMTVQFKWAKRPGALYHHQAFDVIIDESDYDIENLMVMRKARGLLAAKIGHADRVNVKNF